MKQELEHDYLVHNKHSRETPVFHRIKFDETSIFLTQASYSKLTTGKSKQGHYRVFPWTDFRAKALLGFEIGQESPALGSANLIGSFKPKGDDLTEIKYHSFAGKAYFESAQAELNGQSSNSTSTIKNVAESPKQAPKKNAENALKKRIDASNFMKMKEIIPTGAQGKAIYGEGNYIIDGAAGTGKSTTVLQKIKLLQLHSHVPSDHICIIVKNQQVVQTFTGLLNSLDIRDIKIYSQDEFVKSNYENHSLLEANLLESLKESVDQYVNEFEQNTELNKLISRSINQYESPKFVDGSLAFQEKYKQFLQSCEQYCLYKVELGQSVESMRKSHTEELNQFQKKFEASLLARKRKSIRGRIKGFLGDVFLELGDQAKVREATFEHKNKLSKKAQIKSQDNQTKLDKRLAIIKQQKAQLVVEMRSPKNLNIVFNNRFPEELVALYFNKLYPHLDSYHTIIVDEAQDVQKSTIELIRLKSNNTILAGDESQTEMKSGVGFWKNVLFFESEFSSNGKPKIFHLRHNFRQTYELGTVSYNYRQLMLQRPVENIKQDYFDDQIGFTKPSLVRIKQAIDFIALIETKLVYIKERFLGHFPLVIFYENDASLHRFQELIGDRYKVCLDQENTEGQDIMFVSIDHIAGREFPVVVAPLANNTLHSTIYIMLSRAKIDLTLALSSSNEVNPLIQKLIDEKLIFQQN